VVRYRLVRLLDRPDELLGSEVDSLDEGDEVEILEQHGTYRHVITPDGRQGWLHRMTLGDVMARDPAPATDGADPDEDVLLAYLAARVRA
jgi:SH3-like domain-containing protein